MTTRKITAAVLTLTVAALLSACGGEATGSSKLDLGSVGSIDKTIPDSEYNFD